MEKIRVMLAEDYHIVRAALRTLINSQPDMKVVDEADNGHSVITKVSEEMPDVIVMDITLPELNGLKTTKRLKQRFPDARVLILTSHTHSGHIQQFISAGVSGYLLKQSAPTELMYAIRTIAEGNYYLDPAITGKVIGNQKISLNCLRGEQKAEISPREAEVLSLMAFALSNKEIAASLQISEKTVEAHKYNAMQKLNLRSRTDIVRYAILSGWFENMWLEED